MSYKYFFKSTAAIAFGILISSSEALAFTCPDSSNPEVVSSDCTQMVVQENKSSVTINSGVTVSDGGTGSAYGPVRIAGSAIVGVFTNNGNIENTNTGNLTAIEIANGSGVTNFVNTGNISTMASSTFAGLKIYGSINTLTNSGTIAGSTGAGGIYVSEGGNIGTLVNSANGHINGTAGSAAIMISGGIFSTATSVGSITNLGVIQGIHAESGGVWVPSITCKVDFPTLGIYPQITTSLLAALALMAKQLSQALVVAQQLLVSPPYLRYQVGRIDLQMFYRALHPRI